MWKHAVTMVQLAVLSSVTVLLEVNKVAVCSDWGEKCSRQPLTCHAGCEDEELV